MKQAPSTLPEDKAFTISKAQHDVALMAVAIRVDEKLAASVRELAGGK